MLNHFWHIPLHFTLTAELSALVSVQKAITNVLGPRSCTSEDSYLRVKICLSLSLVLSPKLKLSICEHLRVHAHTHTHTHTQIVVHSGIYVLGVVQRDEKLFFAGEGWKRAWWRNGFWNELWCVSRTSQVQNIEDRAGKGKKKKKTWVTEQKQY